MTSWITDGGLETDLIFRRGLDLPDFAAFPLLDRDDGRATLCDYYDDYARIAHAASMPLVLESPTWRANPDWGARLGYDAAELARVNELSVELLHELAQTYAGFVSATAVSGSVGPRHDGYSAEARVDPDQAAEYHQPQLAAFASAGADRAAAYTLAHVEEAIGVVRAARGAGVEVGVCFTVETDGRLPNGMPLDEAIETVDAVAPPDFFGINCAHPSHMARALEGSGPIGDRILSTRVNASRASHAELDEADVLDDGDPIELAADQARLTERLGGLSILGGCCGTDARHVAAMVGVELASTTPVPR